MTRGPRQICGHAVGDPDGDWHDGDMRWEDLFADLEAQLASAHQQGVEEEAAEQARAEYSRVRLTDRLRLRQGEPVRALLTGAVPLEGRVRTVGAGWVVLEDRGTEHLMTGKPYAVRLAMGVRRPRNPVPGRDVAGEVVSVGAGVTRFAPGDEVYGVAPGSFADYAVAAAMFVPAMALLALGPMAAGNHYYALRPDLLAVPLEVVLVVRDPALDVVLQPTGTLELEALAEWREHRLLDRRDGLAIPLDGGAHLLGAGRDHEIGLAAQAAVGCLAGDARGPGDVLVRRVGARADERVADLGGPALALGLGAEGGDRAGQVRGVRAVDVGCQLGEVDLDDLAARYCREDHGRCERHLWHIARLEFSLALGCSILCDSWGWRRLQCRFGH